MTVDSRRRFLAGLHEIVSICCPGVIPVLYSLNADGVPTSINNPGFLWPFVEDSSGRFLFDPEPHGIGVRSVDASLTFPLLAGPFGGDNLTPVEISPDQNFLYAFNRQDISIHIFHINADGTLVETAVSPAPSPLPNPFRLFTIHPSGHFAYESSDEANYRLDSIDPNTGALILGQVVLSSPPPPQNSTSSLVIEFHPSGKFLFAQTCINAVSSTNCSVVGYTIDANTGSLTPIPGFPSNVRGFGLFNKAGTFMYLSDVPGLVPSQTVVYSVDVSTGILSPTGASYDGLHVLAVSP